VAGLGSSKGSAANADVAHSRCPGRWSGLSLNVLEAECGLPSFWIALFAICH
jgi:hypothetical protein